jgi:glycosyltransferase involved in cell wall biosynthesis
MNTRKNKILFIHSQLVQHGSERYLFELCKALDQNIFEINILTRFFKIKNNYYYPKLINIGCKIHTRLISLRYINFLFRSFYNKYYFLKYLTDNIFNVINYLINYKFLQKFDIIIVIGIETYCDTVLGLLGKNSNVIIHHVTHRFQFDRDYFSELNQDIIVINDDQQKNEILNSNLNNPTLFFLPLPMNFQNCINLGKLHSVIDSQKIRIGVFSRLFKDRPNEPIFYRFQELSLQMPNLELYFYGSGDSSLYNDILTELNITDKVFFKGHSNSISKSIVDDHIKILWLVSMDKSISYSSIEIASLGMPMVFWNLSNKMNYEEILYQTAYAINSFNNKKDFILYNIKILHNDLLLNQNGQNLRNYVLNYFDINHNIKELENFYLKYKKYI